MNGSGWVLACVLFLLMGLAGAAVSTAIHKSARGWLVVWTLLGAVGFAVMGFFLTRSVPPAVIFLPPPFPALELAPLPLASLWAWIAAVLFASAVVATFSHPRQPQILYALIPLQAGIGVYLWSGDGLLLLISWEFISAITYLGLVTTRRARPVWEAGWVLLALSELGGMLLLLGLVWLMPLAHGSLQDGFSALAHGAHAVGPAVVTTVMVLALVAFGVKAGLFPVMIWMPMAEPEAPGVVAGLFSGLLTGLAISGILAIDQLARPGETWGIILLVLGVLGAVSGALYSVVSRHVKRVLAYSTLEVLGLVFAALGIWHIAALVSPGNIAATLALDGAIVLLVMHAGAKFVLFAVTDYTGHWGHTLDRIGGLIHQAPRVAAFALVGALSLAGLPPLGGFVGEWLVLEAILKPLGVTAPERAGHLGLLLAGAVLALAMALGVASYLRWYGFVFLGPLRHPPTNMSYSRPRPLSWGLVLPTVVAAAVGPAIPWFLPWLNHRLGSLVTTPTVVLAPTLKQAPHSVAFLVHLGGNLLPAPGTPGTVFYPQGFSVGDPYVLLAMGVLLGLLVGVIRSIARRRQGTLVRYVSPWTGGSVGYQAKTSYSAEGFVHPLRLAFSVFYGLKRERAKTQGAHFYRHTIVYRLEEQVYRPIMGIALWVAGHVRRIQSGKVTQYVAYVWIAVLVSVVIGIGR